MPTRLQGRHYLKTEAIPKLESPRQISAVEAKAEVNKDQLTAIAVFDKRWR